MSALPPCPSCGSTYAYEDRGQFICPECGHEWTVDPSVGDLPEERVWKDANGNVLQDGDTVTLIKDLKVKGSGGVTLKRGTLVKNIRLTGDTDEIEANVDKVRGLVLRVEFVKKA